MNRRWSMPRTHRKRGSAATSGMTIGVARRRHPPGDALAERDLGPADLVAVEAVRGRQGQAAARRGRGGTATRRSARSASRVSSTTASRSSSQVRAVVARRATWWRNRSRSSCSAAAVPGPVPDRAGVRAPSRSRYKPRRERVEEGCETVASPGRVGGRPAGQQETRTEEGRSGSRASDPAAGGRIAPVTPASGSFRRSSRRLADQNQRRPASRLMARATNGRERGADAPHPALEPSSHGYSPGINRPSTRGTTRRERHPDREATRRSGYPGSRTKVLGGASGHSPEVLVDDAPIGASGTGLKTPGSVGR